MNPQPNPIHIRRCAICGGEAVITAHDPATDLNAGRCCAQVLDDATRMIKLTMASVANHGLRHPHPGEFTAETNH